MFLKNSVKRKPQRRALKNGRVILSGAAYSALKAEVLEQQQWRCTGIIGVNVLNVRTGERFTRVCGRGLTQATSELHHKHGRGMAGSKRSDTVEDCECLCIPCHKKKQPGWITAKIKPITPESIGRAK